MKVLRIEVVNDTNIIFTDEFGCYIQQIVADSLQPDMMKEIIKLSERFGQRFGFRVDLINENE